MATKTKFPPYRAKFPLGKIRISDNALHLLNVREIPDYLVHHQAGHWGLVSPSDKVENDICVKLGVEVMSVYQDLLGTLFHIVTDIHNGVTTVKLAEEA